MTEVFSSNTLVGKMAKDDKLLTLKVDLETLAEFQAAAKILGARSYATLLNQHVVQDIRQAKELVSKEEFERIKGEKKVQIQKRSEQKSMERKKSVEKLTNDNIPTVTLDEVKKKKTKK